MKRILLPLLVLGLVLIGAKATFAQGPCAEIEVSVLNSGYLGEEGIPVFFHKLMVWPSASDSAVTYTINPEPAYTTHTDTLGYASMQGLDVTAYEIRAERTDGATGSARIYCASASRSKVVLWLKQDEGAE